MKIYNTIRVILASRRKVLRSVSCLLVVGSILLIGSLEVSAEVANLREYTSTWGWVSQKQNIPGPTTEYLATSYFHGTNRQILWTIDNVANLRTYTLAWGWVSQKQNIPGPGAGYTATSYWQDDTYRYILWTADNVANLRTYTLAWGWVSQKQNIPGPGAGYTATSYWQDSTNRYILWTADNVANLRTHTLAWGWVSQKQNIPGPGTGYKAVGFERGASSSGGGAAAPAKLAVETILVKKAGSGTGTITAGSQLCDVFCTEMAIPYIAGKQVDLTVTPAVGSYFVGWETAGGVKLENIYYANPGDTVFAIFEQQ